MGRMQRLVLLLHKAADLQVILRRAALMLRNVSGLPLEPATEDALNSIAAEMKIGRSDLIQIVLREWLETNAYLPVRTLDRQCRRVVALTAARPLRSRMQSAPKICFVHELVTNALPIGGCEAGHA
ncbi:hypothetical protein [Mesorhizobium sp.]|uniref:hypothetical protein n=1 Tax=Mesorhizobium sp. TaxID=1871066 RepID=UPI00257A79BF|nr:hypothetical protein [Mesorhizobium sp.]